MPAAVPATAPQKVRLDLAYNGTQFRGFAENQGVRTVAGDLRAALERVLNGPVELTVAGRTDAGVHATAQVVSFASASGQLEFDGLADKLNKMLAPDIAVSAAVAVPGDFDARHSAKSRSYQYVIRNATSHDPLRSHRQWHLSCPLDLAAMNAAARCFIGEHDFSSFCRQTDTPISLTRHVLDASWTCPSDHADSADRSDRADQAARLLVFDITAWAFCHQMIRSIVGLCVTVGQGRQQPEDVPKILAAKDRNAVKQIAPPQGLTLVGVSY